MKCRILLIVLALISLAVASAEAAPLVLYENDFTTRTSLGAIGGATTYGYSVGNLIGAVNDTTGTQDSWIRRNTGTLAVTVADNTGNQYAQFGTTASQYAYALQPIGSEINQGVVRISADVLAPTGWTGTSRTSLVMLGDDDFYAGSLVTTDPTLFFQQTASWYGYRGTTNTEVKFGARDGDGSGGMAQVGGAASVTSNNWYRFIADLDLYSNTYSVDVYDMGAGQPTLSTATPATPVQSFTDMGFRRNMGSNPVDLNGITTLGIASFGNASPVGFDNIVVSDPRHEYVRHVADTNPVLYWQFEDAVASYDDNATNKAADTAMLLGGKNEGFGVHRSGIGWPTTSDAGIRGNAMASVKGSAMGYDGLKTAGVPVDNYSVQMWVKSTSEIALYKPSDPSTLSQSLNYFFARSHGDPANVSNSNLLQQWQLPDNLSFSGYGVTSPRLAYISWDLNGGGATAATDDGDGSEGRPLTTVTPITHDEWYHVVFTRNPDGDVSVYLNGELEIYKNDPLDSGSYTYDGEYMVIGERANYGIFADYGLNGLMDEVAVWGRALTAEEVRGLYHTIPEPSAFALFALAALCLLPLRRRGRRLWSAAA